MQHVLSSDIDLEELSASQLADTDSAEDSVSTKRLIPIYSVSEKNAYTERLIVNFAVFFVKLTLQFLLLDAFFFVFATSDF